MKCFVLGANGMRQIDTEKKCAEVGEIIYHEFCGCSECVIYDITHDLNGYTYLLINLSDYSFRQADYIPTKTEKGGGIGYYRSDAEPETMTPEQVAEVKAEAERRKEEEERKLRAEAEERERIERIGAERLREAMPAGAVAVIVAQERQRDDYPGQDYIDARTGRTVILGFSFKTREDFSELRSAAAGFPETAYLSEYNPEYEHREKYSMGHGYYLGESYYHGWIVRKCSFSGIDGLIKQYAYAAGLDGGLVVKAATAPAQNPRQGDAGIIKVEIVDYSDKAVAVFGDTKPIKDTLRSLGGRFAFMRRDGQKCPGWAFRKADEQKIREALAAYL